MSRWSRRLVFGAILGGAVVLASGEVGAQPWIGLGTWDGALEAGYAWDRQETKGDSGSNTKSGRTRYDERLTVRNTGAYYLDPRLVSTSFSGSFGLFQEQDRFDNKESSTSGTLLGYTFDTVILSEKPYSLSTFASRTENVLSREFGGRSELSFENRGGTFRLREDSILQDLGVRYFSSTVGARQEHTKEDTKILDQTFRRDETRNIFSYEASKGFETSDFNARYEFIDLQDKERSTGDFRSQTAELGYSLDFGENLNRRWSSRLNYFARSGLARSTYLSVDEQLRIDHYENLFTDYRYLVSRIETDAGATTTQNGTAKVQHRLYQNLTTAATALATLQDLPDGERKSYAGQLDLDYQRAIPWNGRIFAGAGARYQIDDNQIDTSRIDVVDESHTAPNPLGGNAGFLLGNPFVIVSTIVMVDTRGGARLPTTLGVDYLIVQEGDLTKIVPLAASPVILPGDPLAVSYSYEVAPSLRFSTVSWRAQLGADFRWIAMSLAHEQSEQSLLSGRDDRFLDDRTVDTARLELRGDWERVRASASAQYQVQESTRLAFTSWQYGQLLTVQPLSDLVLSLTAQETFANYTIPVRRSTSLSTRGDLTWSPLAGLFVNAFASLRTSEDSGLPSETIRETGIRIRWTRGKMDVAPTFTWVDRERGTTQSTDMRFELKVTRRF
ncbi:MAG: hypothetical protein Q7W02_21325 [Candidatus Rokubacteria bacterium]|nr:hypothetical protein [Candidatus Rokubacteria bacterium]